MSKKKEKKAKKEKNPLYVQRELCRFVASRQGRSIDPKTREDLKQIAIKFDVTFEEKPRCPNCWSDLAVVLYRKINDIIESDEREAMDANPKRYELRPEIDVMFGNIRVNSATLTDALAVELLKRGFPRHLFRHLPEQEEGEGVKDEI